MGLVVAWGFCVVLISCELCVAGVVIGFPLLVGVSCVGSCAADSSVWVGRVGAGVGLPIGWGK